MQGIIYTRVSSDEQVKGTSLESQEELCRKYCVQNGIELLEVFREEGASAKTADRAELLRALEYCRKRKGKIQAFVVAKVDRFARNTEDHFYVRKLLLQHGVVLHSVTEPIGNSPTGKFVETVLAASSEFDNAIRKQRFTYGMLARLNQGLWPWKPPIGYLCLNFKKRGEKKTEPDPPDPKLFPLIQRGLKEYAAGVIRSQAELAMLLNEWGFERICGRPIIPQLVDRLLGQYLPFYAGLLANPWSREVRKGRHIPMITEQELAQIRDIRAGKARTVCRDRHNPLFPLRRTILCGACNHRLTGGVSRGNGGRYPYYHCANRKCGQYGKAIRKERLESEFTSYLRSVTPKAPYWGLLREIVLDVCRQMKRVRESEDTARQKALGDLQERRRRIFEMREDGSYTREMFEERMAEIERQITPLNTAPAEPAIHAADLQQALDGILSLAPNLSETWRAIAPSLLPRFQNFVFPEGIAYDRERGFRTARLGLLFELFWQSTGERSRLVDLTRISWNQIVEEIQIFSGFQQEQLAAA